MSLKTTTFTDGLRGKVVEQIRFTNEEDLREVQVWFADQTIFHLRLSLRLHSEAAELTDWSQGNAHVVHTYSEPEHKKDKDPEQT
jgi:hypothetical protein